MRNSPINYIRQQREREQRQQSSSPYAIRSRQSPERGEISSYSPDLNLANPIEGQYWRQRSKQLQVELVAVNQELLFQVRKNQNVEDLEGKIQLLLAQNTHFVDENENLIRLVQQKNAEIQMWKKKFDSEYSHSNMAEAEKKKIFDHLNLKDQEHQVQIDKLLTEISRLQDQATDMESLKQIEINQLRNKYENQAINQIQTLKRSQYGNNQLQELNIRKLKDQIEEKKFEIENLRRQAKLENQRLNGEISFLKNQVNKVEHQKQHEIDLIRIENENTKNNLLRTYKKNQEQLKNLHETKVKRLVYEIQEKKNELEDTHGRLKRGGKQNETEINRMTGEKSKMRVQLKENDNRNRNAMLELTKYYENQVQIQRQTAENREKNLSLFYEADINSLKQIIEAKQKQIQRLLELNAFLKKNQQQRLEDIRGNNKQLKEKMQQLIKHYEREVQLMKIKISQLYKADLDSLKNHMSNSYANHSRQNQNLRALLKSCRQKLAKQVQDKLDLRRDYQNRLDEFKVKYQREHQQLHDLITMHEKQLENQTSKASLTHIEHNDKMQKQHLTFKELASQKRRLQAQIQNKNKQIQSLNEQIQKMLGFHKRQVDKFQEEINKLKNEHKDWIQRQDKENQKWSNEKSEFKQRISTLNLMLEDNKNKNKQNQEILIKKNQNLNLQIAGYKGQLQQYQSKVGQLHSKNKLEVQNIQKTHLQTQSMMNDQKEKHFNISKKQRQNLNEQYNRNRGEQQKQIDELRQENDLLRDNYEQGKIREQELKAEVNNLLDSVNQRNKLQEHVINIGLSNNYFKNVAEIFKKNIDS